MSNHLIISGSLSYCLIFSFFIWAIVRVADYSIPSFPIFVHFKSCLSFFSICEYNRVNVLLSYAYFLSICILFLISRNCHFFFFRLPRLIPVCRIPLLWYFSPFSRCSELFSINNRLWVTNASLLPLSPHWPQSNCESAPLLSRVVDKSYRTVCVSRNENQNIVLPYSSITWMCSLLSVVDSCCITFAAVDGYKLHRSEYCITCRVLKLRWSLFNEVFIIIMNRFKLIIVISEINIHPHSLLVPAWIIYFWYCITSQTLNPHISLPFEHSIIVSFLPLILTWVQYTACDRHSILCTLRRPSLSHCYCSLDPKKSQNLFSVFSLRWLFFSNYLIVVVCDQIK